ncbi:hypothetical protein PV08_04403 [Exophiala spinifera]|uniref:Small ribosomal subunit protein uS9m n=1 Tax=Exophiala spinifera TaxID=91928 RepID=A0A0D1ZWY5_9EURO|nr:uncharacterized protein PV08_04403 [Exophiala spinifera]KIW17212.1 hypothetical protein PV08_04403 [Exophiala spinifera]
MARPSVQALPASILRTCRQCRVQSRHLPTSLLSWLPLPVQRHGLIASRSNSTDTQIQAAPEIDLSNIDTPAVPARVLPASPSYFTASPLFNDNVLLLQSLVKKHSALPLAPPDNVPRGVWLKLSQYRSSTGETVPASKYTKVLELLTRLNKIHPRIRPREVREVLDRFRRPGSERLQKAKPGKLDRVGRSVGIGRRKESGAKVYLVEGTGEVLVNGRNIVQAFPRLHDRESALWALKATERADKYNVFAMVAGGGVTGQAEAITLAVARALLVHEPALKPALRRAGCLTSDRRRVERKKPGRLKARKKPAWVKR